MYFIWLSFNDFDKHLYDFASNGEDYQGHYQLNKGENDQVAKQGNSVIVFVNTTLYAVSFVYVERNKYTAGLKFFFQLDLTSKHNSVLHEVYKNLYLRSSCKTE